MRTKTILALAGLLALGFAVQGGNLVPEGKGDFLAIPKPGSPRPAMLVEFKYFTNAAAEKGKVLGRAEPDAETVEQALAYRKALARRPDWNHPIAVAVVEVCGNVGYNWFDLPA